MANTFLDLGMGTDIVGGSPMSAPYPMPPYPSMPMPSGAIPRSAGGGCSGGCGSNKRSSQPFSSTSKNSNSMNNSVQSWYDMPVQEPLDPRILVANITLGGLQGTFTRSTNFIGALTWNASPFSIANNPNCTTLHTDDQLAVAQAFQWNFSHQTANLLTTNPIPLRKMIFLRGGTDSVMTFNIALGAATYNDLQISFRDNAATPGMFTGTGNGTIPAFLFTGPLTGTVAMQVTLNMLGTFVMAISARDTLGNSSMFEMEWVVVA